MLAELTWTLVRRYRLDKAALIATVEGLLSRVLLDVEGPSAMMAIRRWYPSGSADVADYLVAARNRAAGTAPTNPFDEQATSSPAFALVP